MPVKINGATSGSVTLAAPASGSDVTLTLPTTGFGKVLQVVSTTKTDTFSTTSTSFTVITGLTATITPSSASSKILVIAAPTLSEGGSSSGNTLAVALGRDGSVLSGYSGDAAGSRTRAATGVANTTTVSMFTPFLMYLDAPASTSALTYSVMMRVSSNTGYCNRSVSDSDNSGEMRGASTITVIEVAA